MKISEADFIKLRSDIERLPEMELYLLGNLDLLDPKDYDTYISESSRHSQVIKQLVSKLKKKEVQIYAHEFLFRTTKIAWKWQDADHPIFYQYHQVPLSCTCRAIREIHGGIDVIIPDNDGMYSDKEALKIAVDKMLKYREERLESFKQWREILESKPL